MHHAQTHAGRGDDTINCCALSQQHHSKHVPPKQAQDNMIKGKSAAFFIFCNNFILLFLFNYFDLNHFMVNKKPRRTLLKLQIWQIY
jgi:hypothetical protein